jgi:hypothetical protein
VSDRRDDVRSLIEISEWIRQEAREAVARAQRSVEQTRRARQQARLAMSRANFARGGGRHAG